MEISYSHKLVGLSQFINELDDAELVVVPILKEVIKTINSMTHVNDASQDSEVISSIRDIAWSVFEEEI